MAVLENGQALEGLDESNGHAEPRKSTKQRRSRIRWTVGLVVRLCIWYTLLTPFFRCPSRLSDLDESSPRVCKPYLIARSHIEPHVVPYYNTYGAPYVDLARPYTQVFHERVYSPVASVTKQGYDKYGAPALERARIYGQEQWDAQVVPRLRSTQDILNKIYAAEVEPYVQRAVAVISPHYQKASGTLIKTYGDYIVPYYARSRPFIGKTYTSGQEMLATTVMPFAQNTWSSLVYFANSSLWPKVTGLYSENVEPQLVKIGQRLASYREGKRLRAVVDEAESVSEQSTVSTATTSAEAEKASTNVPITSTSDVPSSKASLSPTEQIEQAREKIASDLKTWQEKFAIAADKGVEDLEERVKEIVESHINSGAKSHGETLLTALNTVVESELSNVKQRINTLAESLPAEEAQPEEETAQEELLKDVRQAAIAIKERAHALRQWYNSFDQELTRRVSEAVDSTVDVLDSIRDLGLQEIGMRWAWMDGVTYKDWAKYHALKAQFEDWRNEVSDVGMQHETLEEARSLANEILAHGMDAAEAAAKELGRLKEVGKWKISAREVSDNFETRSNPPPALPKPSSQSEQPSEETVESTMAEDPGYSQGATASVSETTSPDVESTTDDSRAAEAPSTEDQYLTEEHDSFSYDNETLIDPIEEAPPVDPSPTASADVGQGEPATPHHTPEDSPTVKVWGGAAAQAVPEPMPGVHDAFDDDDQPGFSEKLQSFVSEAGANYAEATKAVSEALLGPSSTPGFGEEAASLASDHYSRALSAASSVLYGTPLTPGESVSSAASEKYAQAVAAASSVIYGTQPPLMQSLRSEANSVLSDSVDQVKVLYEIAKSQIVAQLSESSLPIHSQLLSSIEAAYSGSVKYATEELNKIPPVIATPTPSATGPLNQISSIASSRLSEGLSVASAQLAQIRATVAPTPTSGHNRILLDAERRYYEAIGLAHDHYSAFVSSASQAVYGSPTPTPGPGSLQNLVKDAKFHYDQASSSASANLAAVVASASSAIAKGEDGAQGIVEAASSKYHAALSAASASLSLASASASSGIYGTPTGSLEALASQASENWESLISKASEQVYGTQAPYLQQIVSRNAPQFEAVQNLMSELLVGKEPSFTESVFSKLQAVYETPYPVSAVSSASSYVNEAYESASSIASAYVTSVPTIEEVLDAVNQQLNAAIDAASIQVYGTPKGSYEQAISAAASAYGSASAKISEAVYGHESGYIEVARGAIDEAFSSAGSAISHAIYTPTPGPGGSAFSAVSSAYASATAAAADDLSSASSAVDSAYSRIHSKASTAIYGEQQGALESASSKLTVAVESAQARLADLASSAGSFASAAVSTATAQAEDFTGNVKSAAHSIRDEL